MNYTYVWFGNIRTLLKELFDEEAMSVPIVAAFLEMPPSNNNQGEVALNWLSLISALVTAITMLVVVFITPEVVPITAASGSIISTAFRLGALAAGGDGGGISLTTQVAQLQRELLAARERALACDDLVQSAYLQHWGLLKALGQPIESLQLTWPVDLTDRMAAQGRRGYELTLWQTLVPPSWRVYASSVPPAAPYQSNMSITWLPTPALQMQRWPVPVGHAIGWEG